MLPVPIEIEEIFWAAFRDANGRAIWQFFDGSPPHVFKRRPSYFVRRYLPDKNWLAISTRTHGLVYDDEALALLTPEHRAMIHIPAVTLSHERI
jgi:hypothetical protein